MQHRRMNGRPAAIAAALAVLAVVVGGVMLVGTSRTSAPRAATTPPAQGAAASAGSTASPAAVNTDPWDYCATIGDIDRPEARYLGDGTRAVIQDALALAERLPQRFADPAARRVPIPWRCMGGAVWACDPGANLPCGPAQTSREPSEGMRSYCAERQPNGVLPAFVTGHDTIYAWSCKDGAPVIDRQVFEVDARGFVARFWYRLDRPS